jgi:VWFA-related protein
MKKLIYPICVICVICAYSPAAQPSNQATQSQPRPQFEARADVVLVDVTVISGNGEPVNDLKAEDFQLTVNGQTRSVHTLQYISSRGSDSVAETPRLAGVSSNDATSSGRLLLFVVDENYLRAGSARAVLRTAERVMNGLPAGDLVGLARLPTGRGGVEFTTDRARIRRALDVHMGMQPARRMDRVRLSEAAAFERRDTVVWEQVIQRECGSTGAAGSVAASFGQENCVTELEMQAKALVTEASGRTRQSISGFEQLAKRLATLRAPVNIVLISEGLFVERDRNDLNYLARLAAEARISFFVVQPDESIFDLDSPMPVGGLPQETVLAEGLEQIAGLTRGSYFKVATSGAGVFERIGRELSGYYLLSFEPTDADRISKDRRIKVEVRRRGLTVRSRSTYAVADATAADAAVLSPAEQIKDLLTSPLPTAGLPIRVASYSVTNPGDARVRVIVSAEIGEATNEAADWPIGLLVIDKNDKVVIDVSSPMRLEPASSRTESPRLLLTSLVLDPGEYALRVAAVGNDGTAGSVHHTIDAKLAAIAGRTVYASDLILTSEVAAGEPPRPVPSSIIFSEQMVAVLELAAVDSKPLGPSRVTVEIAESESSSTLIAGEARPMHRSDEQRTFFAPLRMTVLPPGDYVARAVVKIPGQPDARITRSFKLAPVAAATDASPIAARVSSDEAPAPLPVARIVTPVAKFSTDDVLKPDVVRAFLDVLQRDHPVSAANAAIVQQAREGHFVLTPSDNKAAAGDEPTLAFIRGLAQLRQKQYAQAAAWFQLALKSASDFLGAAFYLGAVHAASGRDHDAVGAWQMSLIGDGGKAAYPPLVDALLRIGDAQAALDLIAEEPDAWADGDARLSRVATAQAMLGQYAPALETLNTLLQRRATDLDLLFVAIQVLYRQHLARPLSADDRARFDHYSKAYLDTKGPEAALVDTWRKYVLR